MTSGVKNQDRTAETGFYNYWGVSWFINFLFIQTIWKRFLFGRKVGDQHLTVVLVHVCIQCRSSWQSSCPPSAACCCSAASAGCAFTSVVVVGVARTATVDDSAPSVHRPSASRKKRWRIKRENKSAFRSNLTVKFNFEIKTYRSVFSVR